MGRVFVVIILVGIVLSSICMGYSGGAGTADEPYQIADANDLLELAADTDNYDKCFILTADIDLAGQMFSGAVIAPDTDCSDYGFVGTSFTGVFDGNHFTIRNLTIDLSAQTVDHVGLFGRLGFDSEVKDLNLSKGSISVGVESWHIGFLAGENYKGIISDCTVQGEIFTGDMSRNIGGLTGTNWWLIYCCSSYCTVYAGSESSNIGGLAGCSEVDFYEWCFWYRNASIVCCNSSSSIHGGSYVGGLIGYLSGYLVQSRSDSNVYAADNAGGLIGGGGVFFMVNCFAAGQVSGGSYCGGLGGGCGRGIEPTIIQNCYSVSTVSVVEDGVAGGLISDGFPEIESCYYLTGTGPDNSFGTPLTDVQMRDPNNFVGWDFAGSFADGSSDVWEIPVDGGHPMLGLGRIGFYDWTTNSGMGTQDNPYVISNALQLLSIGWNLELMNKHFVLDCDINLQAYPLTEAVIGPFWLEFCGSFDGNGHKIKNLSMICPDPFSCGGLFETIYNGDVKKLGIEELNISIGDTWCTGGLAAMCISSEVQQCFATGQIQDGGDMTFSTSGLAIGYIYDGIVHDCYTEGAWLCTSGDVTTFSHFVGVLWDGQIRNCYVKNTEEFCIHNYNGQIQNCFWGEGDYEFTYQNFIDAGWDFVDETANGAEDIWRMRCEGMNYPKLSWQTIPAGDFACPDGVAVEDLDYFIEKWLLTNCTLDNNYCGGADINLTGTVDMADLAILAAHWLEGV